jgi:hypothetical protein
MTRFGEFLAGAAVVTICFAPLAAQQGPAPGQGSCRTYDTSITSVTAGGPVKATVESSGVFDPWSLRLVQNISVSSNQGAHFSYVQVTTWNSVEDFIAEVVRLKPPATLATNPNGPVLGIVPPLMRSVSTTGNGTIVLTKTNNYDMNGRLTGFVGRSVGGTITVRYSAWDALGRPTAGTMTSPASSSSITIAHDDVAMTETQTTTSRGISSVITNSYDQLGNLRSSAATVTRGQGSATTYTSHGTAKVCLGDTKAVAAPPVKPAGPNPSGSFTGTIGGHPWSAAVGMQAITVGPTLSVGGSDSRYIVAIALSARSGPGQYRAGSIANEDFTKLTEGQFIPLIDRNSVVATVMDSQTKQSWQASPVSGGGTVNLASASGGAAGTFSLTLDPVPGTGASGSISFNGSFNIRY